MKWVVADAGSTEPLTAQIPYLPMAVALGNAHLSFAVTISLILRATIHFSHCSPLAIAIHGNPPKQYDLIYVIMCPNNSIIFTL